jgi:hypothetical protein
MTAIKSLDTNTYTIVIGVVLNTIATRTRLKRRYMLLGCIYDLPRNYNCRIHGICINIYVIQLFRHFVVSFRFKKKLKLAYELKIVLFLHMHENDN